MTAASSAPAPELAAAAAKINLYLHVLGRRDDGYHLLDSLIAFAGAHDTLRASPGDGLTLRLSGPFAAALTSEPDNLVLRAARLLAEAAGITPKAELFLVKRLPVASGIGGGSADAAAALRALSRLWGLSIADSDLAALGLKLGADVPACLLGRAAFLGGIGAALEPVPSLPAVPMLLVNPGIALPTPKVFAARRGAFSPPARFEAMPRDAWALADLLAARRNDLTEAATALVPEIGAALDLIKAQPGCLLARMSGSGATCFGLFANLIGAGDAQLAVNLARPRWWARATQIVSDTALLPPFI